MTHLTAAGAARLVALATAVLVLNSCERPAPTPPAPQAPAPTVAGAATTAPGDTSVPSADSVFGAGAAPRTDAAAGRTNTTLTQAQESTAMPMAGQNNDHSAPLAAASAASGAPRR